MFEVVGLIWKAHFQVEFEAGPGGPRPESSPARTSFPGSHRLGQAFLELFESRLEGPTNGRSRSLDHHGELDLERARFGQLKCPPLDTVPVTGTTPPPTRTRDDPTRGIGLGPKAEPVAWLRLLHFSTSVRILVFQKMLLLCQPRLFANSIPPCQRHPSVYNRNSHRPYHRQITKNLIFHHISVQGCNGEFDHSIPNGKCSNLQKAMRRH